MAVSSDLKCNGCNHQWSMPTKAYYTKNAIKFVMAYRTVQKCPNCEAADKLELVKEPKPMEQNEVLAANAVKLALSHVGEREATGNNDGAFVDAIEKPFGERHAAWCAMYATSMIKFAAQALGIKTVLHASESSTEIFAQAKRTGLLLKKPIPNCIGLLKGNGGAPGKDHHHTFLVVSVDWASGLVHSVDGNWGNQVSKPVHRISDCDFVGVA